MTHATTYPGADRSRWKGNGNATLASVNKIVLHTTESSGLPSYSSSWPNLTYDPAHRKWYQHTPINGSATSLRNDGSHQTNRANVVQVEIIGFAKDAAKLPASALADLGHFLYWMHTEWEVPLAVAPTWTGPNTTARMSWTTFSAFRGVLGHQHVPGNDHWDPGQINAAAILEAARREQPVPTPTEFSFWIAQLNIQNPDYRSTQLTAKPWSQRLPKIVDALKDGTTDTKGASLLLLNECPLHCAADIASRLGKNWTWDRVGLNVVMRPKDKWQEVGLLEYNLPGPTGAGRTLAGAKLKREGTTLVFWSSHLETFAAGHVKTQAEAQAWRDKQAAYIASKVPSKLCVGGGDFNDTDTTSGPRAILREDGLLPLADRVKIKNDTGTSDSGKKIDEIVTSKDVQVTFAERIDPGVGSDHRLTRARIVVNPRPLP